MSWLKKGVWLLSIASVLCVIAIGVLINPFGPSPINNYPKDGELVIPGLNQPVRICRDEKGMAYIHAQTKADLFLAQGYVTAMDRLFQMSLTKLLVSGRIGELVGEKARQLDIRMKTLGFHRQAKKHLALLNDEALLMVEQYVRGVNAFINSRPAHHHLEFRLAGLDPEPWQAADCLGILYFMGWDSAANMQHEIVAQMLVEKLGPAKALEIFPLNLNPDDPLESGEPARIFPVHSARLGSTILAQLWPFQTSRTLAVGSNNWVTGPGLSQSGAPILANDPHLEARVLPGPMYPSGLITPKIRAVGVTIPGTPGMVVGRTQSIAYGITNAYGDAQDLYIETVDPQNPENYMEGENSIPFQVLKETLRFKDDEAPDGFRDEEVVIRLTRRGPVITTLLPGMASGKQVTVRWSSYENMEASIGFERFLSCRSAAEFRDALRSVNQIGLNFVFADLDGNFGWQTTGRLPIRTSGDGRTPYVVTDSQDNWTGWIPWEQMPHAINPDRGWVGTTNHKTVTQDFPYYFSSFHASSHRQRRLIELLDTPGQRTVDDHWRYQRDILNLKAKSLAPLFARVLQAHEDTRTLGMILATWDKNDSASQSAPTIFHFMFEELAMLVLADELGSDLMDKFLANRYFWDERLEKMLLDGRSYWFDNILTTDTMESRDELIHQAAVNISAHLSILLGKDPNQWTWGKLHRYEFVSPVRREGLGKLWLGGGAHPAAGSGDTLRRARYEYFQPSKIHISATLRMVVDLGDSEKVLAVLPGGVGGRLFDPHTTDQIESFLNGEKVYWWFSDAQIEAHKRHELTLYPVSWKNPS